MKKGNCVIWVLVALLVVSITFSAGLLIGWVLPQTQTGLDILPQIPGITDVLTDRTPGDDETKNLFIPFWKAWDVVHNQYVDQPVDDELLMQGAIRGMLEALGDPYTAYMPPTEYQQLNESLQGEYEGIGAWVDISGDFLRIVSPMPNSPAEEAGIKPDDMVIAVDGEDMTGIDGDIVLQSIRGPAGTTVVLTIQRGGYVPPSDESSTTVEPTAVPIEEPEIVEITVRRDKITVPSVESEMLDDEIAYLQIASFSDNTAEEVRTALKELQEKNPKGLILDLRFNGGGLLNSAIDVISEFVPQDTIIMYEQYSDGIKKPLKTHNGGLATSIPLVVLVNEGSASASEITAGAIQDLQRGVLVGVTTYGKGKVQNWLELPDEQGGMRVTIARWLTPNGNQISEIGLTPDYVIEFTEEDIKAEKDVQLEKAIEVLNNGD
jgi:carboxyl-terminal processing protease